MERGVVPFTFHVLDSRTVHLRESQRMGAPLVIKPKRGTYNEDGLQNGIMERFWLEGFLELNPMVKEYSYVTYPFHKMTSFARKTIITNVGRITTANLGLFGGSPNVFDNTDPAYTRVVLGDSELESMYTLSEQMYTAKGAYAFHIGRSFIWQQFLRY